MRMPSLFRGRCHGGPAPTSRIAVAIAAAIAFGSELRGDPVVEAFFQSSDPFVRNTVLPNIEKHRKADVAIALVDASGQPVADAAISAAQFEQSFLWGCVPPSEEPSWNTSEIFKLWRALYNFGIAENALKWDDIERFKGVPDFSRADRLVDTIDASGAQLELHFLIGYNPPWLKKLPENERSSLQREHGLAMLEHFHDRVKYIQVYNEAVYGKPRGLYVERKNFFAEVASKYPDLHFGINDCWPWNPAADNQAMPTPAFLKAEFPGIAFVGNHCHLPHSYWAKPQDIYRLFDRYIDSGVHAQICEFGIMNEPITGGKSGDWTEDLRTEFFVALYATVFSHPAVEAFNQWGMGPRINRWTANELLDENGKPQRAYYALKTLLRDKFTTRVEGRTDQGGTYSFRGFKGRYLIRVVRNDALATAEIAVNGEQTPVKLVLIKDHDGYRIDGGARVVHWDLKAGDPTQPLLLPSTSPVVIDGLADVTQVELLADNRQTLRTWDRIGERLEWDGRLADQRAIPSGKYQIRTTSVGGETALRPLSVQ